MKIPIKQNTIFISIASYRDEVCNQTLKSIYNMAQHPHNVYCGVVQQNNNKEDNDCLLSSTDNIIIENVRIIRLKHYEAKGPCWARYLASTLWSGEEFFIQIDSHTKFVKHWDTKCIHMMHRLRERGQDKVVISHYPKTIESYNDNEPTKVTRMCQSFFNNRDMISFLGAGIEESNNDFYETPYVAGGFILSTYKLLEDVPFDPNLDFLFVGEEIGHSIRIWTSGYNIYTPSENIVYHEYEREGKPKVWDDNEYNDMDAFEKIKLMIGIETTHLLPSNIKYNIDKYSLGNKRTLQQYYDFAGIDLKKKRVYKNFCRKNNIATEEDIKQSNEIDHDTSNKTEKKEEIDTQQRHFYIQICIFCFFMVFLFMYYLIITKFKFKFKFNFLKKLK